MSSTDKEALWAQLQEIQKKEIEELNTKKRKFEEEKEVMERATADPSDIVKINAGGEIIHCHRRTLCLAEGSMFSNLFSGRWDESWARDEEGRIFLDHDPELIKLVVNYLRFQRIKDPSKPKCTPKAPQEKKQEFRCLLEYFGLCVFFAPHNFLPKCAEIDVEQPYRQEVTVSSDINGEFVSQEYNGSDDEYCVTTCKPALANSEDSWWKVTLDTFPQSAWVGMGIIGALDLNLEDVEGGSFEHETWYGWSTKQQEYKGGILYTRLDLPSFKEGEAIHFCLIGGKKKLAMFCPGEDKLFQIRGVDLATPFIHFNFATPQTKVSLSRLTVEEHQTMAAKLGMDWF